FVFFYQAEDGVRDGHVTGVQTCALPIFAAGGGIVATIADARIGSRNGAPAMRFANAAQNGGGGARPASETAIPRDVPGSSCQARSEERRVGKEGRTGWGRGQ